MTTTLQNIDSDIKELVTASKLLRESINNLWIAQNPDEYEGDGRPLTPLEAQEQQSEIFTRAAMAEYRVNKRLGYNDI